MMDISEQYVKMCDCPEIRDWFTASMDLWKDGQVFTGITEKGKRIGLLRQDQIQEMCDVVNPIDWYNTEWTIWDEAIEWRKFDTGEKLWLAFYMHEKHRKYWNENKWNKENQ